MGGKFKQRIEFPYVKFEPGASILESGPPCEGCATMLQRAQLPAR